MTTRISLYDFPSDSLAYLDENNIVMFLVETLASDVVTSAVIKKTRMYELRCAAEDQEIYQEIYKSAKAGCYYAKENDFGYEKPDWKQIMDVNNTKRIFTID